MLKINEFNRKDLRINVGTDKIYKKREIQALKEIQEIIDYECDCEVEYIHYRESINSCGKAVNKLGTIEIHGLLEEIRDSSLAKIEEIAKRLNMQIKISEYSEDENCEFRIRCISINTEEIDQSDIVNPLPVDICLSIRSLDEYMPIYADLRVNYTIYGAKKENKEYIKNCNRQLVNYLRINNIDAEMEEDK